MKNAFFLFFFGLSILTAAAFGQTSGKDLARFTILIPKEGMQKLFEDGYKRHLQWHLDQGDKWNWYGWFVASGDRIGYFVDATFGHHWADFDQPVDPIKDAADNAINVLPFARVFTQFTCAYLPEVSKGSDADLQSVLLQTVWIAIKPGGEDRFETFLLEAHRDWQKSWPNQSFLWYRMEDGAQTPQYLLVLPHKNFAEKERTQNLFAQLWARNPTAQTAFQSSVKEMVTETLRYRPDLTLLPK